MQATVNLRVLDANTFLRDSLIGSYQFDLLGIYVEKVSDCESFGPIVAVGVVR